MFAKERDIPFIETSDETGMNIDETFEKLARLILKKVSHNKIALTTISLSNNHLTKAQTSTLYKIRAI